MMASEKRALTAMAAVVALALFTTFTTSAAAEPTAAEKETARQLMDAARDRVDVKDWKGAAQIFKTADDIMHVPTTGWELARAQSNAGMLVEARETTMRIAALPKPANEPEPFRAARASAADLQAKLETRVPKVNIEIRGAKDKFFVTIDGVDAKVTSPKSLHRLNPGSHTIVATAAGHDTRAEISLAEGETKNVVLTIESKTSSQATEGGASTDHESRGLGPLVYIGFGTAAVGVIAGTITGLMMFSKKSDLEAECTADKVCPDSSRGTHDEASTFATLSTLSFAVAGGGAVVGVIGLLVRPSAKKETNAARIEPWIGLGGGGLRGSF
jgi:hypothetical protein